MYPNYSICSIVWCLVGVTYQGPVPATKTWFQCNRNMKAKDSEFVLTAQHVKASCCWQMRLV